MINKIKQLAFVSQLWYVGIDDSGGKNKVRSLEIDTWIVLVPLNWEVAQWFYASLFKMERMMDLFEG